ncbi:hypothetical protein F5Y15DRAFT_417992 [Xylariaceae sp. FL0016]|nr:hypothetical protein F5Y15DRAFT_417992 [Xylariaceae sp. FL0016]
MSDDSTGPSKAPSRPPTTMTPASATPPAVHVSRACSEAPSKTPSRPPSLAPSHAPSRAPSKAPGRLPTRLIPVPEAGVGDVPPAPPSVLPGSSSSIAPLRSVYQDPEDLRRAQLQSTYSTLTPAQRAEQDVWAKGKADKFAPCPMGYAWERHPSHAGYRCKGGAHYISDGILAEGLPGLYGCGSVHLDLRNAKRKPGKDEGVPDGYYGIIRPVGVDCRGLFTYERPNVDEVRTASVGPVLKQLFATHEADPMSLVGDPQSAWSAYQSLLYKEW